MTDKKSLFQIAKILRVNPEVLLQLREKMGFITGRTQVFKKLYQENQEKIKTLFWHLKIQEEKAEAINRILLQRLIGEDHLLYHLLNEPDLSSTHGVLNLVEMVKKWAGINHGLFLKKEKARELLLNAPPPNLLKVLGYQSIQELLAHEDILEIFPALRFIESSSWMHQVFLPQYQNLTSEDFEKRALQVIVLPERWVKLASKFLAKKYHNVSHLKELGIIFIIPLPIATPGETLRIFTLVMHYFYEVDFYSRLAQLCLKKRPEEFGQLYPLFLKGEITKVLPPADKHNFPWLIIPRYLAKENKNHPLLSQPHVSSEAMLWGKVARSLKRFARKLSLEDLEFWTGLEWVGEFYPSERQGQELISFDILDNLISLAREKILVKYLYHQQEALWNRIFQAYVGDHQKLERLILENFAQGYIPIKKIPNS